MGNSMTVDGHDGVFLTNEEFQELVDSRDSAHALAAVRAGVMPTISDAEMDAYLAAPTPLAFWRNKRGLTQSALAEACGISQPYVAQLENGTRASADILVYAKLSRLLGLRIEDLISD